MPNVSLFAGYEYTDNAGVSWQGGSLDIATVLAGFTGAPPYQFGLQLAQNATGTLWLSSQGPSDFAFAVIQSDTGDANNGYVILEETTDVSGTPQLYTKALAANVPVFYGSSQSYTGYVANFGGGTLSKIQRFRVKNLNSSTANVQIWLIL